jgi:hypothetical protein
VHSSLEFLWACSSIMLENRCTICGRNHSASECASPMAVALQKSSASARCAERKCTSSEKTRTDTSITDAQQDTSPATPPTEKSQSQSSTQPTTFTAAGSQSFRTCKKCFQNKPKKDFPPSRHWCRDCVRTYHYNYRHDKKIAYGDPIPEHRVGAKPTLLEIDEFNKDLRKLKKRKGAVAEEILEAAHDAVKELLKPNLSQDWLRRKF